MWAVKLQGRDKRNCPIEQRQQLSVCLTIHVFMVLQPPDANCVAENAFCLDFGKFGLERHQLTFWNAWNLSYLCLCLACGWVGLSICSNIQQENANIRQIVLFIILLLHGPFSALACPLCWAFGLHFPNLWKELADICWHFARHHQQLKWLSLNVCVCGICAFTWAFVCACTPFFHICLKSWWSHICYSELCFVQHYTIWVSVCIISR